MTPDKAEWCTFAIWVDCVALCSSTFLCASGSTFDSGLSHHWKVVLPLPFYKHFALDVLGYFCRTCSGILFCVHTWAGHPILPCLVQTMSLALTHSALYFFLIFNLFTVVCIWLSVIVAVMRIINVITFFRCSSCSSDDIFIGGPRFWKAIFALHTKLCTRWISVFSVHHILCQEFFGNSNFLTLKRSNCLVHSWTSDLIIL